MVFGGIRRRFVGLVYEHSLFELLLHTLLQLHERTNHGPSTTSLLDFQPNMAHGLSHDAAVELIDLGPSVLRGFTPTS